jgi:hypothetical protein
VFFTRIEVTFVYATVRECFHADALLHVFDPLATVFLACFVLIIAKAIRFVGLELALEHVSVCMMKDAFAFRLSMAPFASVLGPIAPGLGSLAVLKTSETRYLACVETAIRHPVVLHFNQYLLRIETTRSIRD